MKKVLYLHGLESKQGGPKVDFLANEFIVHAPKMDYNDPELNIKMFFAMCDTYNLACSIGTQYSIQLFIAEIFF